ncbi:MAG TPA: hypothetical protein VM581_00755 [Magnetospirillaceae bacterium]|nr:hypothetical protein [Magnetospirillaceae bacterium]
MRKLIVNALPLPLEVEYKFEIALNPLAWIFCPKLLLQTLGIIHREVREERPENVSAQRRRIATFVEERLPYAGDFLAHSLNDFDAPEDWFGSFVPAAIHVTIVRATHDRAVWIHVRGGLHKTVERRVIALPSGLTMNFHYDSVDEVDFTDADTYGGYPMPELLLLVELSVMDQPRCAVQACTFCARLRDALETQGRAA